MRQVPQIPHYYRQIITLFILIVVDELGFWILLPVLAPLINETSSALLGGQVSPAMQHLILGIIMGLSPFCAILSAPLLGFMSDQIGRKKVLLICLTGTFIGFVCYAFSFWWLSLPLLLLARIIIGVTTASQAIVQAVMADLSQGKQKAINISIVACAMTLPLVIGPLIGGLLSDNAIVPWFNRSTPFIFAAILSLLNLLMLAFCFYETKMPHPIFEIKLKKYLPTLFGFMKQPEVRHLLLIFLFMELGWSLYFQSMPLLLVQKFNFNSSQVGFFSSYIGIWMSLGLIFLTRIFLRFFSLMRIVLVNLSLTLVALLGGFIAAQQAVLWLIVSPIAIGIGLTYTALITRLSDKVSKDTQGLLMGFTDAILYFAFACTGLLAGLLTAVSATLPLLMASIFILISYLASVRIKHATYK